MGRGKRPAAGPGWSLREEVAVGALSRLFRGRGPVPVLVQWQDGEPVEFRRRASRRGPAYRVVAVRERWVEPSPWPFPSPEPVGGDRLRCWRVRARPVEEPAADPTEFVLRMRAGPGVWELVRVPEGRADEEEGSG